MTSDTRLLLTFLAGFCDALTFVYMGGVFSAHVTGNFVIFAAVALHGVTPEDYLKLLTILPFVAGVALGTGIFTLTRLETGKAAAQALFTMAALFLLAFLLAAGGTRGGDVAATLMIVLAMGIQNSLHQFVRGPMTTVMTGTVTAATAALVGHFLNRSGGAPLVATRSSLAGVAAFAAGCGAGALCAAYAGFHGLVLPALLCGALGLVEWRRG